MVNKLTGLLGALQNILRRAPIITIYKSLIKFNLNYGDISYDESFIMLFMKDSNSNGFLNIMHYLLARTDTVTIALQKNFIKNETWNTYSCDTPLCNSFLSF